MAISQEDLNTIVNAVLSRLGTNAMSIGDLNPVIGITQNDYFELQGGKKVAYSVIYDNLTGVLKTSVDSLKSSINNAEIKSVQLSYSQGFLTLTLNNNAHKLVSNINAATTTTAGVMTSTQYQTLDRLGESAITSANVTQTSDKVTLTFENMRSRVTKDIPGATSSRAGVMTATQYDTLYALSKWTGLPSTDPGDWPGEELGRRAIKVFNNEKAYQAYRESEAYDPMQICGIIEL